MSLSVCPVRRIYIKLDFTSVTQCAEEAVIEVDDDMNALKSAIYFIYLFCQNVKAVRA